MLKSVKIENFRCFKSFELQQLGRINLLVGENNSGKTSILEAIQLLCSRTNLEPLGEIMINRGEYFWSDHLREERELDISHLFNEHEFQRDSTFSISGINDDVKEDFSIKIGEIKQRIDYDLNNSNLDEKFKEKLIADYLSSHHTKIINFQIIWQRQEETTDHLNLPLSDNNCLDLNSIRRFGRDKTNKVPKTIFINSSSLNTEKMTELFNEVVLNPEEELVTEALKIIDNKIERIAPANVQKASQMMRLRSAESHTGFYVRLADSNQRVPIGSMGDGIWRILGIILATVCAKDGYLFIDEIDTGLHFTTMSDMWKLIWQTAKRLNVQVFATTHNSDCWQSLADIAEQEDTTKDGIRIHRIEKGKERSIVFTEPQMVIAAERELEVR
ncbi:MULTISPECIES: AAA family ATPase [unclassified Nodularia (in: cyanobacteria)]|uniref:AAA family ATPase n=1 Tax=unclassified Nodularia (in: cyanobacteria) TaxID=2656917 RepID=UPI00187E3037|nr:MULTISPECIES: AAA family ATPase [unclassified Nodularia (in: cyanobacteria)]MBE9197853.1 AAA family ATPase [Nodularia sp. LEGE 06071]MCC2694621.1 AAA family ATPase [Nodularia sp. LEGE 04288]